MAQVALYLKVTSVDGESVDANHTSWIDLESFHWGASQPAAIRGGGVGAGKASFHDLTCVAKVDKAYPNLLDRCASGEHIATVEVHGDKAGGKQMTYLKIELNEVLVTAVDVNGANGADVMVSYSFQGSKLKTTYTPQTAQGGKGGDITKTWDIKKSTK
jgi:type VI secretion system Hcp family effector